MPNTIIPITDLRNTNEISKLCHESNQPIYVTKNGYGDLVVMSIEKFEEFETTIEILKSELEYAKTGESYAVDEVFDEIWRKHFGKVQSNTPARRKKSS